MWFRRQSLRGTWWSAASSSIDVYSPLSHRPLLHLQITCCGLILLCLQSYTWHLATHVFHLIPHRHRDLLPWLSRRPLHIHILSIFISIFYKLSLNLIRTCNCRITIFFTMSQAFIYAVAPRRKVSRYQSCSSYSAIQLIYKTFWLHPGPIDCAIEWP